MDRGLPRCFAHSVPCTACGGGLRSSVTLLICQTSKSDSRSCSNLDRNYPMVTIFASFVTENTRPASAGLSMSHGGKRNQNLALDLWENSIDILDNENLPLQSAVTWIGSILHSSCCWLSVLQTPTTRQAETSKVKEECGF